MLRRVYRNGSINSRKLHWRWNTGWLQRNYLQVFASLITLAVLTFCIGQYVLTYHALSGGIQSLQYWVTKGGRLIGEVNVTRDVLITLEEQKAQIQQEIGTDLSAILYGSDKRDLRSLTPYTGGTPFRSIIATTWRSGSTFVGDVLNSLPGNYYHYEPLLDYDIVQIRGPPASHDVINRLRMLLSCNYTGLDRYLEYGQDHVWLFTHNTRLWDKCQEMPHLCWLPQFLSQFCSLFPFQSMKVVRVRLALYEQLLKEPSLGIKILYLARDPRGTLQSRSHREWCPGNPDCADPSLLCADLVSDFSSTLRFYRRYPDTFRAIRYEDLSTDPFGKIQEILKFFGFRMHPDVAEFLDTHTKFNIGGVSSTFRDSKSAPFHWREDLSFEEVSSIQQVCEPAMKLWGYLPAYNETHQKTFNPVSAEPLLAPPYR